MVDAIDLCRATAAWRLTSRQAVIALAAVCLSSCTGLHLYSPSTDTAAAAAADAFPSEAVALRPFDDQLSRLDAFAAREDLVVARYWTDVRDAHLVRLIAMDRGAERPARTATLVDSRLTEIGIGDL